MEHIIWKISGERYWDSERACWIAQGDIPRDIGVTPLIENGELAGVDRLRETIRFYGARLGELKTDVDRIAEIDAELERIDVESVRPLRTIENDPDAIRDHEKLIELDRRAEDLRAERRRLTYSRGNTVSAMLC